MNRELAGRFGAGGSVPRERGDEPTVLEEAPYD